MANAAPQLQEAFELIESGDLQSARQLLEDIRPEHENNPDYWWIYAHAVENEEDGISALDRVRQLAPNYPGLESFFSEESGDTSTPYGAPSTEDVEEFYDEEDEFVDLEPASSDGNNPLMLMVVGGIVAVIAIIALIAALNSALGGNNETPTETVAISTGLSPEPVIPTLDAESATEEATDTEELVTEDSSTEEATEADETEEVPPTDEPIDEATDTSVPPTDEPTETNAPPTEEPTETDEPPTEEATATDVPPTDEPTDEPTATNEPPTDVPTPSDPFADLYEDLEAFGVPEDGISIGTTENFGDTYIVTSCSELGPIALENIVQIMDTLEPVADSLESDVDGVSFDITDCDTETVRRSLGIDRDTAEAYWAGEIDATELQQSLRLVN